MALAPTAMFPLQTALLPGSALPLQVFEPRYLQMIEDLDPSDMRFGVVLIERGSEVGGGDVRFDVATLCKVIHMRRLADNRLFLIAAGEIRIRVHDWLSDDPYPRALTEPWPDEADEPLGVDEKHGVVAELTRLVEEARRLSARLRGGSIAPDSMAGAEPVDLGENLSEVSYRAASMAPLGALDRYRVLCVASPTERLRVTRRLVSAAVELLQARVDSSGH